MDDCCTACLQVSGQELGSRKKAKDALPASSAASGSPSPQQKSGGRGKKFQARKSREAAAKAASLASDGTQSEVQGQAAATSTSQMETVKVPDSPPSK
jgi:hypothetical protein